MKISPISSQWPMLDTQANTVRRIKLTYKTQRVARFNRRINACIEISISAMCGLLLSGFLMNLLNWHSKRDTISHILHGGAEFLVAPFQSMFSYASIAFYGGVFSPIYLIAAVLYIFCGMALSGAVRKLVR
jgi:hypothetical protein